MEIIIVSIVCSIIASVATTKILATHYFKIVDGYVENIANETKEFVNEIKGKLL